MKLAKEVAENIVIGLVVVVMIGVPVAMFASGIALMGNGHYVSGAVLLTPIAVFILWAIGRGASL